MAEALVSDAVDHEFAPDEFKRRFDRLEGLDWREVVILAAFLHVNVMPATEQEAAIATR